MLRSIPHTVKHKLNGHKIWLQFFYVIIVLFKMKKVCLYVLYSNRFGLRSSLLNFYSATRGSWSFILIPGVHEYSLCDQEFMKFHTETGGITKFQSETKGPLIFALRPEVHEFALWDQGLMNFHFETRVSWSFILIPGIHEYSLWDQGSMKFHSETKG